MDIQFWVHQNGWIYTGDCIEGARQATEKEIADHLEKVDFDK